MGFVLKKGAGTDAILGRLFQDFFLNIDDLVDYKDSFKRTGSTGNPKAPSLEKAAQDLDEYPDDPRFKRLWKKWLKWLDGQANTELLKLTDAIYAELVSGNPYPIMLDWVEHNYPLSVVVTPVTDNNGRKLHTYIAVKTQKLAKIFSKKKPKKKMKKKK